MNIHTVKGQLLDLQCSGLSKASSTNLLHRVFGQYTWAEHSCHDAIRFIAERRLLVLYELADFVTCNMRDKQTAVHRDRGSILDALIIRLPEPLHINIKDLEEQPAVESEAPEDCLVVLQASECISWVPEYNILPVDVICRQIVRVITLHRSGLINT